MSVLLWSGFSGSHAAATLGGLEFPLRCSDHVECVVQNLFDHDPGPSFSDYNCGALGYDGHDGVDIRVANLSVMDEGVAVLAAAPGVVRAVRNDMQDINIKDGGLGAIKGHEAGNAVAIRHGSDWETQYSHLRRGSVQVKPGDSVKAGDVLGLIGLSGRTEFPHLHFEVRHRGKAVDPFVGPIDGFQCGSAKSPMWSEGAGKILKYRPTGLLQTGFATDVPTRKAVEWGETLPEPVSSSAPAIVFWVELFGVQQGDIETIQLFGPDNKTVISARTRQVSGDKARWLSYVGRKRRGVGWDPGVYQSRYELMREHAGKREVILDLRRTLEVN